MATDVLDEALASGLREARKKPRNFAIIAKGAKVLKMFVQKKPIKAGELRDAKSEYKGNLIIQGVCQGDGGSDIVFNVLEEAGIKTTALREFISEQAGLTMKPRFEVVNELAAVEDELTEVQGEEEGTPPAPPPPPGDGGSLSGEGAELDGEESPTGEVPPPPPLPETDAIGALVAKMNKLAPAVQSAVKSSPDRKADVLQAVAAFQAHVKAKNADAATDALRALGTLLKELSAAPQSKDGSSSTSSESQEAESEQSPTAEAPPPPPLPEKDGIAALVAAMNKLSPEIQAALQARPDLKSNLAQAVGFFQSQVKAKNAADAQIALDRVQQLLKQAASEKPPTAPPTPGSGDAAEFLKLWTAGQKSLRKAIETVEGQLTRLAAALLETGNSEMQWLAEEGLSQLVRSLRASASDIDRAGGKAPAKIVAWGKPALAELEQQLDSAQVKACDQNQFGAKVTIRDTIGKALAELTDALKQAPQA